MEGRSEGALAQGGRIVDVYPDFQGDVVSCSLADHPGHQWIEQAGSAEAEVGDIPSEQSRGDGRPGARRRGGWNGEAVGDAAAVDRPLGAVVRRSREQRGAVESAQPAD